MAAHGQLFSYLLPSPAPWLQASLHSACTKQGDTTSVWDHHRARIQDLVGGPADWGQCQPTWHWDIASGFKAGTQVGRMHQTLWSKSPSDFGVGQFELFFATQ
eukprot:3715341-Rhodomonas_salina.1